ncbi:uncharacterized protein LOC129582969 [Paramacrobiotus metropolitanus]|uniref:uncharacterized protein LOC129582969 n=1 Tax=Paramacrobiotus metropolitanus TaxID=2943436 RepID=UPI0024458535|nr:uncharacterized protein LOC129582969 [Paramacrobiotus metropolitanus]
MHFGVVCDLAWLQLSVLSVCLGCLPPPLSLPRPQPSEPPACSLEDMITDAMRTRQDDRLTLPLAPDERLQQGELRRPRLGEDAAFSCEAPPGGDWRSLTWLHRGRTVFEGGHAPPEDPAQRYNVSRVGDRRLQLVVFNVTAYSGGPLLCVDATPTPRYTGQPRFIILRRFTLLPQITRASEVFEPLLPTPPVTSVGVPIIIPCRVRLPIPEAILRNQENHYFWRYKGRILRPLTELPYGALPPSEEVLRGIFFNRKPTISPNLPGQFLDYTLELTDRQASAGAELQCFFRPHEGAHEWVFQTTTITVLSE